MQVGELVCSLIVRSISLDRNLCLTLRQVSWRFLGLIEDYQLDSIEKKTACDHRKHTQRLLSNGGEYHTISKLLVEQCYTCYAHATKRFYCVINSNSLGYAKYDSFGDFDYVCGVANSEKIPYVLIEANFGDHEDLCIVVMKKHIQGYDLMQHNEKPKKKRKIIS